MKDFNKCFFLFQIKQEVFHNMMTVALIQVYFYKILKA